MDKKIEIIFIKITAITIKNSPHIPFKKLNKSNMVLLSVIINVDIAIIITGKTNINILDFSVPYLKVRGKLNDVKVVPNSPKTKALSKRFFTGFLNINEIANIIIDAIKRETNMQIYPKIYFERTISALLYGNIAAYLSHLLRSS